MAEGHDQQCVAELYGDADAAAANNDLFWLLLGSMLVFFMQAGFAMLEAGQVRIKNRNNMLIKNVMDACLGGIVWYVFGYPFAYGKSSNGFIGFSWDAMAGCGDYAQWLFQWTFAVTAATIVSGAIAERCRFMAYLVLTVWIQGFVYPVIAHWVWSGSGWLGAGIIGGNGLMDFAGGGVVHLTGGTAALVGAYVIGPRVGRFSFEGKQGFAANDIALTTLGTFSLWFSWYGFNCVSTGSYSLMYAASRVAVNTTLGACAGGCGGILAVLIHTRGVPDIISALNGILGGLVSITAGAVYFEPYICIVIGLISGCLVFHLSRLLQYMRVDDVVDASPVHLFCGAWGVIAVGLFASPNYVDGSNYYGVFYGGSPVQLGIQVVGVVAIFLWSGILTGGMFAALRFAQWLRVPYEDEVMGLDKLMRDGSLRHDDSSQQYAPSNGNPETGGSNPLNSGGTATFR